MNFITLIAFAGTLLTGCAALTQHKSETSAGSSQSLPNSDGLIINPEFDPEKMVTVEGETFSLSDAKMLFVSKDCGLAMLQPESWEDTLGKGLDLLSMGCSFLINYLPEQVQARLEAANQNPVDVDSMSDKEFARWYGDLFQGSFSFASIYVVDEKNLERGNLDIPEDGAYEVTERIASANGLTYYLAYNTALPSDGLSDRDRTAIQCMISSVEELKKQLVLFPPFNEAANFAGTLSEFTTQDLTGKEVNQSIFSDYDLTMVNVWATWCGFCVEEMPDLGQLYQQLPKNVNLISICSDAAEEAELARKILDESDAEFQTLVGSKSLQESCLRYISGLPTTLFVDRNGNVVGDIQIAAPEGKTIVGGYMNLIKEKLAMLER